MPNPTLAVSNFLLLHAIIKIWTNYVKKSFKNLCQEVSFWFGQVALNKL